MHIYIYIQIYLTKVENGQTPSEQTNVSMTTHLRHSKTAARRPGSSSHLADFLSQQKTRPNKNDDAHLCHIQAYQRPTLFKFTHPPAIPHPFHASGRVAAILPGSRMLSINPSIRQSNCSHASHAPVFCVYRQEILNILCSCEVTAVRPLHGETALPRA